MKYDFTSILDRRGMDAIRMNLALPRARVEEAFRRLAEYVFR